MSTPAPADRAPLLVAEDLEKEYRLGPETVRVLRGVSLTVGAGESVAVIGASGVGKSTLLHVLGALDRPTAGRVTFAGEDVFSRPEREQARLRRNQLGFVFQFGNLLGEMTALENAMLPAMLQRLGVAEARERATASLAAVGLADRMAHRPGELSGGEQQRVAIARALANDPAIVLLDEPTGDLDSATGKEILGLLTKLNREEKVTLMVATHDAAVAAICSRVVKLRDGKIESDAAVAAATA